MSHDLKQFYSDNLPRYYNIKQIANKVRLRHMPYYKTRHFVEDYHTNTVDTIHDISNLEEKLKTIIFNMFDENRLNRISKSLPKENSSTMEVENETVEQSEKTKSFSDKITSSFFKKSSSDDVEMEIDLGKLKKAFLEHFYYPLEKLKNNSISEEQSP